MKNKVVIFFGTLLCLSQIFLTFPIAIWARNKFNFEAPLIHSYWILIIITIFVIAAAALAALMTPRSLRPKLTPWLVATVLVIFIQQNFLSWDYGVLDGQTIDFPKNNGLGVLDLLMWITAALAAVFATKRLRAWAANILIAVGAITFIMAGINITNYGESNSTYTIDERAKFDFSKNKNVLVFLFDAYQMDVFRELADSHPELVAPLEGFTLYENNSAVFAKTYPTIPLFLTGKVYRKKKPVLEFFQTVYDGSLLQSLQDKGWDVGLYHNIDAYSSLVNAVPAHPDIMDNIVSGTPIRAKIDTYLQALDLSLFRAAPHQLKSIIFNKGNFIARRDGPKALLKKMSGDSKSAQPFKYEYEEKHGDVGFRSLMRQHAKTVIDDPVFRFYHFSLPHSPVLLDENLNDVRLENNFENSRLYSIAALKLLGDYITRLKEIGVYDDASILILSDHGMAATNGEQYNQDTKSYETLKKFGYTRASARSLLLVKNPGETGPLKRSQAPTSGLDVAPTLAAATAIEGLDFEGVDINSLSADTLRSREYMYYTFTSWDSKYLNDFRVFEIDGDVRLLSSWNDKGYLKDPIAFKNRDSYAIGETLSYGTELKSETDFLNAFTDVSKLKMDDNFSLANDGNMDLNIKLMEPPKADETLLLQFKFWSGPKITRQITINGETFTTEIKPKKRGLTRGFIIPPYIHKSAPDFNISIRSLTPDAPEPLRVSTVKLSVLAPQEIAKPENFDKLEP